MGMRPIPYRWVAEAHPTRRARILKYWVHVHNHSLAKYRHWLVNSPMVWYESSGASCVHHYEGPWNANTGNGYYGGFQMDMSFQQSHGARFLAKYGTANNWPVIDQILVTKSVVTQSGWGQWPNTARMCGLL